MPELRGKNIFERFRKLYIKLLLFWNLSFYPDQVKELF